MQTVNPVWVGESFNVVIRSQQYAQEAEIWKDVLKVRFEIRDKDFIGEDKSS